MRILAACSLALVAALLGCAPAIYSLDPASGPPRTLVGIDGKNQFLASAWWDAGTATEERLAAGFLGSYMFTVPHAATAGAHGVQLRNGWGDSNVEPFTVTPAPFPLGKPRVDRVSVVFAGFGPINEMTPWLYVQVANADTSAEILVNGSVVPAAPHRGLINDLLGINGNDLAYPIYHWIAFLVAPGPRNTGASIQVACRNSDKQTSAAVAWTLPSDAATLDSDGDDIPDEWETNGYDANGDGIVDIDLPALGAHPLRPDVFVEVDVMPADNLGTAAKDGLANVPGNAVWNLVTGAFDAAPIMNPIGPHGINLHLDTSGSVPYWPVISLTASDAPASGRANFYTLKGANFDNANRDRIYHYCIWGDMQPGGYSGISDVAINAAGTDFAGPGDDFIVSFDSFPVAYQNITSMTATFVHELGHDLQQRHGGDTHARYNPTYNSVMSYSWQLRVAGSNATRRGRPVYSPLYYGQAGAAEGLNGSMPAGAAPPFAPDYSEGMGRNLLESALDEPTGMHNTNPVDWNQDGDGVDNPVARDLNGNGTTTDTLTDHPNWFRLVYSGPRLDGAYGN